MENTPPLNHSEFNLNNHEDRSNNFKKSVAGAMAALALGGLVGTSEMIDSTYAATKPDSELPINPNDNSKAVHEMAAKPDYKVPKFIVNGKSITVTRAKQDLKNHGLKFGGITPSKLNPDEQVSQEVVGFYKKTINPKTKKLIFSSLKPGAKIIGDPKNPKAWVYIKQRIIKKSSTTLTRPTNPIETPIPPSNQNTVPPVVPSPEPPIIDNPPNQPPNPETPFNLPEAYNTIIKANSVYVEFSGCSGSVVRDNNGKIAAIRTADHCGKGNISGNQSSLRSLQIYNGDSLDKKQFVTTVDRMISPNGPDPNDALYLVPKGVSLQSSMEAINQSMTNQAQPVGTAVTITGYPLRQPNNQGEIKQQLIEGEVLKNNILMTRGDKSPIITTMVGIRSENSANAVCSPGASGGAAFFKSPLEKALSIVKSNDPNNPNIKATGLYPLSAFYDLRDLPKNADPNITQASLDTIRAWFSNLTGLSSQKFAAVCFFPSTNQPLRNDNVVVYNLVS